MIKSITVTNYRGDSIKLDLARPELSGFVVKSITGLGPGKANVNTTEVSTVDGAQFNSARLSSRNIVISLEFMWKNSIEEVRQLSYKYFPLKKRLKLLVETDNRKAEIEGYVDNNDPSIFSKSEGSDVSIICPNPYFYSAGGSGTQVTVFSGIDPLFEFPFCNDSLDECLIEMSSIQRYIEKVVTYEGDSEIGITITIHAMGDASNIAIYNAGTREVMRINTDKLKEMTGSGIVKGDDIVICTEQRNKYVHLIRDGVAINILNCLTKDADWFRLTKGDNVFAYTAEEGATNLQFKIENRIAYEGV